MSQYLRASLQTVLSQNDPVLEHEWLCHPGKRCADGCDVAAIPERLAVYQAPDCEERRMTESWLQKAQYELSKILKALENQKLSSSESRALYARGVELDAAIQRGETACETLLKGMTK